MPISLRAVALRTSLERLLDAPVQAVPTSSGVRIAAPAPRAGDPVWPDVLAVLRSADRWGSTDRTGPAEVWAHVNEGQ